MSSLAGSSDPGPSRAFVTPSTSGNGAFSSGCKPNTKSMPNPPSYPTPIITFSPSSYKLKPSAVPYQTVAPTPPGVFAARAMSSSVSIPSSFSIPSMPSTNSSHASCTQGAMRCDSSTAFSQCIAGGTYISMGAVPAGMQCVNGSIMRQNMGACPMDGSVVCGGDGKTFSMCVSGGLQTMGNVAAGMQCVNGMIKALVGS